jgi:hypothetical protein
LIAAVVVSTGVQVEPLSVVRRMPVSVPAQPVVGELKLRAKTLTVRPVAVQVRPSSVDRTNVLSPPMVANAPA